MGGPKSESGVADPSLNGGIGDRGIREGDREVLAIAPGVVEGE